MTLRIEENWKKESLSLPYAKAIFHFAEKKGLLPEWNKMLMMAKDLDQDRHVQLLFSSPLNPIKKAIIFTELFSVIIDDYFINFIKIIAQNNRLYLITNIAKQFSALFLQYKGILRAQLMSAKRLSELEIEAIKNYLQTRYKKKVELAITINDALIGGFTISIYDTIIDCSIRYRLDQITQFLHISRQ